MSKLLAGAVGLWTLGVLCACAPSGEVGRAQQQAGAGDLAGAQRSLEAERARRPRSAEVRTALGAVYYEIARDALDRDRDEARYLTYLERSMDEFVTAIELEPRDDDPHLYLGVIDAYRGDLRQALRNVNNARRLNPAGVHYTNIAEIYVYMGQVHKARRWNEVGLKKGAPYGAVMLNDMLLDWREGDLRSARSRFARLRRHEPEAIRRINMARLPQEPRSFEEFAGYCCRSPACGPYLVDACREMSLDVRERTISEEAVLKELRLEMEAKRRLRKVYEQRKELEIRIEDDPEPSPR